MTGHKPGIGSPRVLCVFGTRPEAIKMVPVILGLRAAPDLEPVVAVTAQHRTMLDQVIEAFAIEPDHDLGIGRDGQTLGEGSRGPRGPHAQTQPDVVVLQGDTTTALSAALAGFYAKVPVAHVEAGLRTRDPTSPYPEEVNRRLISQLAVLHLAPTLCPAEGCVTDHAGQPDTTTTPGNWLSPGSSGLVACCCLHSNRPSGPRLPTPNRQPPVPASPPHLSGKYRVSSALTWTRESGVREPRSGREPHLVDQVVRLLKLRMCVDGWCGPPEGREERWKSVRRARGNNVRPSKGTPASD